MTNSPLSDIPALYSRILNVESEKARWRNDWRIANAALADAHDEISRLSARVAELEAILDAGKAKAAAFIAASESLLELRDAEISALSGTDTEPMCPKCKHEPLELQRICEHCGHRESTMLPCFEIEESEAAAVSLSPSDTPK